MLTVIPFHQGDRNLAEALATWIVDLGGVSNHECMVVHPPSVTNPDTVVAPLQEAFRKVFVLRTPDDRQGWPMGPNLLFRRASRQIQAISPQPWLWMEPDAIPLHPNWLDTIAAEYAAAKAPFMGARVQLDGIPVHMSGVGVYPGNAPAVAPLLVTCDRVAFDVNAAEQILPKMRITQSIQHDWKGPTFAGQDDLKRLAVSAVVFHQSKDGSLIREMRIARSTKTHIVGEEPNEEPVRLHSPSESGNSVGAADTARMIDFQTRFRGGPVPYSADVDVIVEQLVAHLSLIQRGGKKEAALVSQYVATAGLVAKPALVKPTKQKLRGVPRQKKQASTEGEGTAE